MKNHSFRLAIVASVVCCFAGCARLPHTDPLPQGLALTKVTSTDPDAPFSLHKADGPLVFTDGDLEVVDLKSRAKRVLAKERPLAVALAPDDLRVAAAFAKGSGSSVRLYDMAGNAIGETTVEGKVSSLVWRNKDELVVAALGIKRFSFGALLTSMLYRWDGKAAPIASTVNSTTVRPHIAKIPEEQLLKSFSMALSPLGDEVALTTLKDPPMFSPFLRVLTHHLDSGGERQISSAGVGSGGPLYAPDGEKVLMGNATYTAQWIPLPSGEETSAFPSPGDTVALSPSGSYALVDGHLYLKGQEIASFPPETAAAFSSDGKALALGYRGALYILTGIDDAPAPAVARDPRLLELRLLHSKRLISDEELRKATGKK